MKKKASNNSNPNAIVSIEGKILSKRKAAFRLIEKGDNRNILWKSEYRFEDGFPIEQSDMDYIAHRIEKNFIRDGVINELPAA